jgi:hypothetical protein
LILQHNWRKIKVERGTRHSTICVIQCTGNCYHSIYRRRKSVNSSAHCTDRYSINGYKRSICSRINRWQACCCGAVIHRISASQEGESSVNIPDAGEAFQLLAARGSGEGATTDPRVDPDAACMRAGADSTQHSALSAQHSALSTQRSERSALSWEVRTRASTRTRTYPASCLPCHRGEGSCVAQSQSGWYVQTNKS